MRPATTSASAGAYPRFGGRKGTYGSVEVRSFRTEGSAESENLAYFLQDTWQITPNFVFNFGVRTEEEKIPNYPINRAVYGDTPWSSVSRTRWLRASDSPGI